MKVEGVSRIVRHLKPQVKDYFDHLIDEGYWFMEQCHMPLYDYPAQVTNLKCWSHFGVFYDYLIRREVYVLRGMKAVDRRAETFKSALKKYIKGNRNEFNQIVNGKRILINDGNVNKLKKFLSSYEFFKNITYRTIDVLEHIFNTAMLHMMFYGRNTVRYRADFIDLENVEDVLTLVKSWDLQTVEINPKVRGKFFMGDADLIFSDHVMDMKVTENTYSEQHFNTPTFKQGIYQMIFYALGYFIETGQEIKKFKVYNPLQGLTYVLKLHFNYNELKQLVDNEPCWEPEKLK